MIERINLVNNKLKEIKDCSVETIADMIEWSFMLAKCDNKNVDKVTDYIKSYSSYGVGTWTVFVKYCYDIYYKSDNIDFEEFSIYALDECIENFIQEYFIKGLNELDTQELLNVAERYSDYIKDFFETQEDGVPDTLDEYYKNN